MGKRNTDWLHEKRPLHSAFTIHRVGVGSGNTGGRSHLLTESSRTNAAHHPSSVYRPRDAGRRVDRTRRRPARNCRGDQSPVHCGGPASCERDRIWLGCTGTKFSADSNGLEEALCSIPPKRSYCSRLAKAVRATCTANHITKKLIFTTQKR